MIRVKLFLSYLLRILLCSLIFASGLVISRLLFHSIGVVPPRMPRQADESAAAYYLLVGSFLLTAGVFPLFMKIGGRFITRFSTIFGFLYACFGISVSVESAIYSSYEGYDLMIMIFVFPVLLVSLLAASLIKSPYENSVLEQKALISFRLHR